MIRSSLVKLRWLAFLFVLSACSTATKPDLPRLYQQSWEVNQPPVILIHGIMGSRLEDTQSGEEVWFGSFSKLVFSDYREVALEIDPASLQPRPSTLAPSGLADQLAGKDFYGNITRTLERAGRYERATPGDSPGHA